MAGSRAAARLVRADPTQLAAIATGVAAFVVYRATLLPGLGPWDTGEAQTVPAVLGTMHPTGFPAYVVLGWLATHVLAPLGSPAFVMNVLSAILVSIAVGTSVLVTRRLGVHLVIGVAIAAGFGLTPVVWHLALLADVHALHVALLVVVVALLLRWEAFVAAWRARPDDPRLRRRADRGLVVAAAVFGVAIADHALAVLLVPAIGLFVLAVEPRLLLRPRVVLAALAACLGVAALLYLELPLRAGPFRAPLVYGHPETWSGFWEVVLARQFQGDLLGPLNDLSGRVGSLLDLATAQLGLLIVLVPFALFVVAVRLPRYALLSGVATAVTCLFAASYANAAIERYYVGPVFFVWTWLAVLAAEVVARLAGRLAGVDLDGVEEPTRPPGKARPAARGALALGAIAGLVLLAPTILALPARWRAVDQTAQTWVDDWLDLALAVIEPDAVVVSWWSYSTPLWYGQLVEGRRTDLWVVDDRTRLDDGLGDVRDVIEANLDTRPVYVIRVQDSAVQALTDRYVIEPVGLPGNVYRVTGRKETSP